MMMGPIGSAMQGELRFGACQVKVAKREIYRGNQLQLVSHKAFDLLLLLIHHRDQVVTKAALSQSLWGQREVSDKLLAKIVVQIRKAIGDEASAPLWIRTVHGVGYSFIGDLEHHPVTAEVPREPNARVRVALLPLENLTGEPHFIWIELGLATLIGQALTLRPQIVVVPIPMVLRALDGVPAETTFEARALALASMVGANCVVQATLKRDDSLRLEYRAFGACYRTLTGILFGDDAVRLGELLAQRLAQALSKEPAPIVRFEHDDPCFNQLLSHATSFSIQRQWRTAIQFIEPALVLVPDSWLGRLLLLRALVQCADTRVFALADEMLAQIRSQHDERREGMVHEALAALVIRRDFTVARQHLEQALRLSEPYEREDWAVRCRLYAAVDSVWNGEVARALENFKWLQAEHRSTNDQLSLGMVEINLASLHIQTRSLVLAKTLLEDLWRRFESQGLAAMQMQALSKLAYVHAALGETALALQLFARADLISATLQDELLIGSFLDSTAALLGDVRAIGDLDRLLDRWPRLRSSGQPLLRGIHGMTDGERHACAGHIEEARQSFQEAIALAIEMRYPFYIRTWLTRLLLLELQACDWMRVHAVRVTLLQQPGAWEDDEVQAWLIHAEAAEMHGDGDYQAALGRLVMAAHRAKAGRAQACSMLSAAWLQVEQGDCQSATMMLESVAPWPHEHPLGIATSARLKFALGDYSAAVSLQQRCIALCTFGPQRTMVSLMNAYEAALSGDASAVSVPAHLHRLITLL